MPKQRTNKTVLSTITTTSRHPWPTHAQKAARDAAWVVRIMEINFVSEFHFTLREFCPLSNALLATPHPTQNTPQAGLVSRSQYAKKRSFLCLLLWSENGGNTKCKCNGNNVLVNKTLDGVYLFRFPHQSPPHHPLNIIRLSVYFGE